MNNGTLIILLTATFPALAILSFLFSLATYFQPLRVHPGTRARLENLEELWDIVPALVAHIRDLRSVVIHERQKTRKLESDLRNMAMRERTDGEAAEDAGDEGEMHSDNHEEGGRMGSERPTRRDSWTVVFPEEQHAREPALPTGIELRYRRSNQHATNNMPVGRILSVAGSILDDNDALEVASATEIPPSSEHGSTPSNDTPSILTQLVRYNGNEETRARLLVEDNIAPLTTWSDPTHTTNGFSQLLRPVVVYDHTQTSSPVRHQPTTIHNPLPTIAPSPSPTLLPRQRPTRIVIQNDTEELRRSYILTQILENMRPRIRPSNITTIVEEYTRSLADADRERAASANGHVHDALTTNVNVTHTPSTTITNGSHNNHTLRPTLTFTDHVPENPKDIYIAHEAVKIIRPLAHILYTIRPEFSVPIIADILARYTTALGLGFADQTRHVMIRPSGVVNGHVYRGGVEDPSADTDQDTTGGHLEDYETRLRQLRSRDEGMNTFHVNGGVVTYNGNIDSTHDEAAERVTAHTEDIRPCPRLSTPELNEAIGNWANVVHTPEGPVLRLRGDREGYESHLRRRADNAHNGDNRTNGYATAIHSSEYPARVLEETPESSTRTSRSASLSGTTLVNSVASLGLDNDPAVVPNANINGQSEDTVELYRNNAYETPAASLRRRRAVSDMRRAARQNAQAERGSGGSNEGVDADIAEAEDAWWGLRDRRRDIMEVEMMQHVLGRERAAHSQQIHREETNGVESEGSGESSDGSLADARGNRPTSR